MESTTLFIYDVNWNKRVDLYDILALDDAQTSKRISSMIVKDYFEKTEDSKLAEATVRFLRGGVDSYRYDAPRCAPALGDDVMDYLTERLGPESPILTQIQDANGDRCRIHEADRFIRKTLMQCRKLSSQKKMRTNLFDVLTGFAMPFPNDFVSSLLDVETLHQPQFDKELPGLCEKVFDVIKRTEYKVEAHLDYCQPEKIEKIDSYLRLYLYPIIEETARLSGKTPAEANELKFAIANSIFDQLLVDFSTAPGFYISHGDFYTEYADALAEFAVNHGIAKDKDEAESIVRDEVKTAFALFEKKAIHDVHDKVKFAEKMNHLEALSKASGFPKERIESLWKKRFNAYLVDKSDDWVKAREFSRLFLIGAPDYPDYLDNANAYGSRGGFSQFRIDMKIEAAAIATGHRVWLGHAKDVIANAVDAGSSVYDYFFSPVPAP